MQLNRTILLLFSLALVPHLETSLAHAYICNVVPIPSSRMGHCSSSVSSILATKPPPAVFVSRIPSTRGNRPSLLLGHSLAPDNSNSTPPGSSSKENDPSTRTRLRNLTGYSFTALRATLRATTGVSLSAVRIVCWATTSQFVAQTMKAILGVTPAWFRYFLQPFLIVYYWPLLILKGLVGSTNHSKKDGRLAHEAGVDASKEAVDVSEQA